MFQVNSKKTALVFIISIVFLFNSSFGFAAVDIEHRTGTIILTNSTGEIQTIEPEQPLPTIDSGTTIEIVTGCARCTSDVGDVATLVINSDRLVLRDKGKMEACKDVKTGLGLFKVVEGTGEIIKEDLTTQILTADQSYKAGVVPPQLPLGTDPVENVGRQTDAELGKIRGY